MARLELDGGVALFGQIHGIDLIGLRQAIGTIFN